MREKRRNQTGTYVTSGLVDGFHQRQGINILRALLEGALRFYGFDS
jgi:hypothetical protein